jgi:hypothetical protein
VYGLCVVVILYKTPDICDRLLVMILSILAFGQGIGQVPN